MPVLGTYVSSVIESWFVRAGGYGQKLKLGSVTGELDTVVRTHLVACPRVGNVDNDTERLQKL
jgi:hypothetical protein